MFQEKITYSDDVPISIQIAEVSKIPHHYHTDIELVYVLEGEVELISGYCHYVLRAGDIFVNNGNEIHSLFAIKKTTNVVAFIHISNSFFTKYFPMLSKSFFRTYSTKGDGPGQDNLRRMLLNILQNYLKKSINYKNDCIYEVMDLINYLNQHFNLFTVDDNVVTTVSDENPITIERLSRIISYMYDNYRSKVTLENISEEEHLSSFYLSHLIKDYTGMSFREFLCFVRVERSEMELLGTNKKISQIAKDVGFSTTAYYRKFFEKWYGRSPEEHRELYQPNILGPENREELEECSLSRSLGIIKNLMYSIDSESAAHIIHREEIDIYASYKDKAIGTTPKKFLIYVTDEDRQVLGSSCEYFAAELDGKIVEANNPESYSRTINSSNRNNSNKNSSGKNNKTADYGDSAVFGWDSIAAPLYIIQNDVEKDKVEIALRDQGPQLPLFKGSQALLTSSGIRKPAYYGALFLSMARGEIISKGDYHMVVRGRAGGKSAPSSTYYLFGFNHNMQIDKLCMMSSSPYETADLIQDFRDRLDLNIDLKLPSGRYVMARYSLNREDNLFHYMSVMGFPVQDDSPIKDIKSDMLMTHARLLNTMPLSSIENLSVKGSASINFTMEGVGLQLAILQKID